jgi:hypothetical protein
VSVTFVLATKFEEQPLPQLIPGGSLVTVPVPVPAKVMFKATSDGDLGLNAAVIEVSAFRVTTQVAVPEQAPCHPPKVEFAPAEAERVTLVPELKDALQVVPQSMPAGLLVIVPAPVPLIFTVSLTVDGAVAVEEPALTP